MSQALDSPNPAVALRVDGDVLWATIDRPQTRNAIDLDVLAGLEAMLDTAEQADVKALVLRGAGGTFCSGANLLAIQDRVEDPAQMRAFVERLGSVLTRLELASCVSVAAVEGYAVAGGCELLLACDIVLVSAEARIGDRHVEYGLVPGAGGSVRLPRTVNPMYARYLLLTGELISGTQAAEQGLVSLAVAPESLDRELDRVLTRLRGRGNETLRTAKAMIAAERSAGIQPALRRELDLFSQHLCGPDAKAGLAAFRDHAKPQFDRAQPTPAQ